MTGYEPTPELIEATAEALAKAACVARYDGSDMARAMLAVVVPLIREQIAAEIEAKQQAGRLLPGYAFGNETYNEGMRAAARVARGEDPK